MIYDTKNTKDLILKIIEQNKFIRPKDIISELGGDKGPSIPTINRNLSNLKKEKQIVKITHKDFKKYGIQKNDKKAVYYTLESQTERAKYYDLVIQALESKDDKIRGVALQEINTFRDIDLNPEQLITLSNQLTKQNKPPLNRYDYLHYSEILRVLKSHVWQKIYPSNLQKFQDNLIKCYEITEKNEESNQCTETIIYILGILGNPIIIKFLQNEINQIKILSSNSADENRKNRFVQKYSQWYMSPIYDKHKLELFEYKKTTDYPIHNLLTQIQSKAKENLKRLQV